MDWNVIGWISFALCLFNLPVVALMICFKFRKPEPEPDNYNDLYFKSILLIIKNKKIIHLFKLNNDNDIIYIENEAGVIDCTVPWDIDYVFTSVISHNQYLIGEYSDIIHDREELIDCLLVDNETILELRDFKTIL